MLIPFFYDRSFIYSDMFLDGTASKEYASFMEINETIFNDLKLEMLYGRLPISSDEVVLSENIFLEYKNMVISMIIAFVLLAIIKI